MADPKGEKLLWNDKKFSARSSMADRLTLVYGERLLEQAGIPGYPPDRTLVVLDNACGTGVVTQALQDMLRDRRADTWEITCGDFADAMLSSVTERIATSGWTNVAAFKIDAQDTKLPSGRFTHIFTNFGPMIFPNASAMLSECHRMLRPQGICGFTSWKKIGWLDDLRDACNSISGLPPLNPEIFGAAFSKGRWWDAEWIENEMIKHEFKNVRVTDMSNTSIAHDREELGSILSPIISIVYTFWTDEERKKHANRETEQRIEAWFEEKYQGGPVEWNWVALVTTSEK